MSHPGYVPPNLSSVTVTKYKCFRFLPTIDLFWINDELTQSYHIDIGWLWWDYTLQFRGRGK